MRNRALVVVFVTVGLAAVGSPVASQEAALATIQLGSHLRISAASLGTRAVQGTAAGFDDGLLVLNVGPGKVPLRIDLATVSRVELRVRESSRGRDALWGAGAGAVAFLVLVAVTDGCGGPGFVSDETCYGSAVVFGVGLGSLIGLFVSHGERWEVLPLDQARRLGNFTGPGLRCQVAVRF